MTPERRSEIEQIVDTRFDNAVWYYTDIIRELLTAIDTAIARAEAADRERDERRAECIVLRNTLAARDGHLAACHQREDALQARSNWSAALEQVERTTRAWMLLRDRADVDVHELKRAEEAVWSALQYAKLDALAAYDTARGGSE